MLSWSHIRLRAHMKQIALPVIAPLIVLVYCWMHERRMPLVTLPSKLLKFDPRSTFMRTHEQDTGLAGTMLEFYSKIRVCKSVPPLPLRRPLQGSCRLDMCVARAVPALPCMQPAVEIREGSVGQKIPDEVAA